MNKELLKKLRKHRDAIGKERDGLRKLLNDIENLHDCAEQSLVLLDEAIDIFSENA